MIKTTGLVPRPHMSVFQKCKIVSSINDNIIIYTVFSELYLHFKSHNFLPIVFKPGKKDYKLYKFDVQNSPLIQCVDPHFKNGLRPPTH